MRPERCCSQPSLHRCVLAVVLVGCAPTIAEPGAKDSGSGVTDVGTTGGTVEDDSDTTEVEPGPVETYRLYINELMASNTIALVDPDDDSATPDWLELHNPSSYDVDLTGFTITDDFDDIRKYTLDGISLPAGSFLVLLADDTEGGIHLPFKLNSASGDLGLFTPEGEPVDRIQYSDLGDNQIAGRYPDDGPLALLSAPTPGASNDTVDVLEP